MAALLVKVRTRRVMVALIVAAILLASASAFALAAPPSTVVAYGVINPSGCEVYKDRGKIRLDFYLTEDAPNYDKTHLYVVDWDSPEAQAGYPGEVDEEGCPVDIEDYQLWLESLPHIWVHVPFHRHILRINDLDIADGQLALRIKGLLHYFYEFHQYCWNEGVPFIEEWKKVPVELGTAREPLIVADNSTAWLHELKVEDIVTRAAQFQVILTIADTRTNTALNIGEEGTIDVGAAAESRLSNLSCSQNTVVEGSNPANAGGTIDTVEVYLATSGADALYAGTFSASGNTLTCRDSENCGAASIGYNQFTGLSIDIVTADYIGCHDKEGSAQIARDFSGGTHVWYVAGEYIDPSDSTTFSKYNGDVISLYGTGEEVSAGTPYSWGEVIG